MTRPLGLKRILMTAAATGVLAAGAAEAAPPSVHAIAPGSGFETVAYSPLVRDIQAALNGRGYNAGPIDGFMGSSTAGAIRAYQKDNGLLIDGQASAALLEHMRANDGKAQRQGDGDRAERVIERTQERLAALGYSVQTTGELDWRTRTAISQYQRDNNLTVDGELDRELALHIRDKAETRGEPRLSTARLVEIERGLAARGYKVGPVDGRIDAEAEAAIRAYQRDRGDQVTGEANEALAAQLSTGLGPALNTPEVIASVQQKLNAAGYAAGPADGVMGPATRVAIQDYRKANKLGTSTAITEDLIASLDADETGSAKPAPGQEPAYVAVMQDDFEDGDFTRNPDWQVHAGDFFVQRGYLSVKLADAAAQQTAAQRQSVSGFLRDALGVQVQSPTAVAAIAQGEDIPNVFKIETTLLGSANQVVQMHMGPYLGSDLTTGYRLVFDQDAGDRFSLVRRSGAETKVLAERSGVTALGDGSRHAIVWTREANGRMIVQIDGETMLQVRDTVVTGSFSGFSFVNLAGTWNMHDIAIYRER